MRLILMIWLTLSAIASMTVLSACVAAGRADEVWRHTLQERDEDAVASRVPAPKVRPRRLDIWRERCQQRYIQSSVSARMRITPSPRWYSHYPRQ